MNRDHLDTGCFVKPYYPEPDSATVVALIQSKALFHSPLHELKFMNALQLKVFLKGATTAQIIAACKLVEEDSKAGVLVSPEGEWKAIFAEAVRLSAQYMATIGCRSLDVLHCATAKVLVASEFISTDARQKKLATAMGLNLVTF